MKLSLSHVDDVTPPGDIGIMFMDHLATEDVLACLNQRLTKVEASLRILEQIEQHGHGIGVDLSIQHRTVLLRADREWLQSILDRLST